jgi:putative membrane protein
MNASPPIPKNRNVSDYLAAERTFLAWIRTGLAFMGFGFVVARFGLFLQRLALLEPSFKETRHGLSIWFGTAMILAGVAINGFAAWNYIRLVGQLNRHDETQFTQPSTGAIAAALVLALLGLGLAIYLISV